MSLTSHLKDKDSPINHYLRHNYPATEPLTRDISAALRTAIMIRPPSSTTNFSTIGMALDYRMRFAFGVPPLADLVATQGLANIGKPYLEYDRYILGQGLTGRGAGEQFFAYAALWLRLHDPSGVLLTIDEEQELARICYVLSLFETIYRQGKIGSPLFEPSPKPDVAALLAIPTDEEVADIIALTGLFYRSCQGWSKATHIVQNPIFSLSHYVGGADGDLVVDRVLYDIKTIQATNKAAQWLRQLVGYVLLDGRDEFQLQGVGFYFARHGCLVEWPLDMFFQRISSGRPLTVQSRREHFLRFLRQQKAGNSGYGHRH